MYTRGFPILLAGRAMGLLIQSNGEMLMLTLCVARLFTRGDKESCPLCIIITVLFSTPSVRMTSYYQLHMHSTQIDQAC